MRKRTVKPIPYSNREIAESFKTGSTFLIRNTPEWEHREFQRLQAGAQCLSFQSIQASLESGGRTSKYPATLLSREVIN